MKSKFAVLLPLLVPAALVAAGGPQPTAAPPPQPPTYAVEPIEKHPEWDAEYSRLIREATTSPQFMTDLVDHLPASATVPTPKQFLGYIAGAPDRLTYAEDVHAYMRALEAASPRVKVLISSGRMRRGG